LLFFDICCIIFGYWWAAVEPGRGCIQGVGVNRKTLLRYAIYWPVCPWAFTTTTAWQEAEVRVG
jgi:hypothetical protein